MLRTRWSAGVGRGAPSLGLRGSTPSSQFCPPPPRGDILVVHARARKARSSLPDSAALGRLNRMPVAKRGAAGRRELTSRPQSLPACTHVRLAKDLVVLLDPKRERLIYVLLADGTEKQKLAKVKSLVALTRVKRVWFVADELGQHDNLVYRVHSACKTDCWEVYAGADTFTTTQQMMLQNGMLPVCPATTAMRARIVPDTVDHTASRLRRPAEADLLFSDVAKRRALKASKRSSIKRVHRYANLLLAYKYAVREVSVNDHINLVRNRDLEALRRRQQMADGGKQGRLSRAYGFEGYMGSADAQMPPLGAFDDEDSSEEEEGDEEEDVEEEDSGAQGAGGAQGESRAGGVPDQGSKREQEDDSDEEEGGRKGPRAGMVGGQGRGDGVELGGRKGAMGGQQDREGKEVEVAEMKGSAVGGERDEAGKEDGEEEDVVYENVEEGEEQEEEEEEDDDDDTGEEWESQDGKPPEVEITITLDKEGEKGDGYNCEVQLGPEADDFTARFNVNEAAVDQPAVDAMFEADGLNGMRSFLERCFKEEVRNLHTIQQLEELWNHSSSTSNSSTSSSDSQGKNMRSSSRNSSGSSDDNDTGAPLPGRSSLTTRLNRQNRLTGRRPSPPTEGQSGIASNSGSSSSSSSSSSSNNDEPLREGRRSRPPFRMPMADRSSVNERPESSSSRSSSSGNSHGPQGPGSIRREQRREQSCDGSALRTNGSEAQGRGEDMMPHARQEPHVFDVQEDGSSSSSSNSREADQTGNGAGEEEQELSLAEEREAAVSRMREMHRQSGIGQEESNEQMQGGGSLDPDAEQGMKGTGRGLSSSTSNSQSGGKMSGKEGDDARDEDSREAKSKDDLPAEDSEEAQQLAHELLGRPVSSSEAAALVAALKQASDVFATPEVAAAEAAQQSNAQAAAEAAAAAAAAAVIAGPGGATNTFSLSEFLQAGRDAAAAAAAAAGGGGGKPPGVAGKRGSGSKGGSKGKKSASESRESRGKQLGRGSSTWDDNNVDAMTRALMEVFGLGNMSKGMGGNARLGRQRPQQQVRLLLEEWPGAWAQPPQPQVPEASSSSSRSSAPGQSPSRVPARRSRGSIFGKPLASRAPTAPRGLSGAAGVTPAGISWGAIGGVGLALGSSGAQEREEQEEKQRRSSVRDLSVVARLMEALHKPPTEVTGEAGRDLIVTLDSGDSSGGSAGSWGSGDSEVGLGNRGRGEGEKGDLISEIGDAWREYEQELMGKGVEGLGLSPAAFLESS